MIGSEKQVNWAKSIIEKEVEAWEAIGVDVTEVAAFLRSISDARVIIDNRNLIHFQSSGISYSLESSPLNSPMFLRRFSTCSVGFEEIPTALQRIRSVYTAKLLEDE
ncbi:hypothetical protein ACSESA_29790 [Pseudomonas aeruginosa]